jgi:hypothetical protein
MATRFWKGMAFRGRRMIMEQLEERIVMDAAVDPIPQTDPFHGGNSLPLLDTGGLVATHTDSLAVPHGHPIALPPNVASLSHMFSGSLDVLLISDAVSGSKQIANAVQPQTKIVYYSAAQDDLDTIAAKLDDVTSRAGKQIAHLAVVSPGHDGMLALGSETLDLDGAIAHRSSFKDLSLNLEPHAQVQLYACSLAGSDEGKLLVNAIATMTAADVFASTDVTGAKPHNWTLEYATYPKAQMVSILDPYKLEQVPGHLGPLSGAGTVSGLLPDHGIERAPIAEPGNRPTAHVLDASRASDAGIDPLLVDATATGNAVAGFMSADPNAAAEHGSYFVWIR